MNSIAAKGAPCFSGSCSEMYLEKAFTDADIHLRDRLPIARELGETSLMFLVHPTLSEKDMLTFFHISGLFAVRIGSGFYFDILGKKVLVTGAGGSIGSELVKQII